MTKIVKKRIKSIRKKMLSPQEPVEERTMKYYLTQAGALFLEDKSKKLIDGKWRTPEEQKVASRPFGHGVPSIKRVLKNGKWVAKPEEVSK